MRQPLVHLDEDRFRVPQSRPLATALSGAGLSTEMCRRNPGETHRLPGTRCAWRVRRSRRGSQDEDASLATGCLAAEVCG
jgi:hypothetical protein